VAKLYYISDITRIDCQLSLSCCRWSGLWKLLTGEMAALLIEELSKSMELPEDVKHRITGYW